ncbi:glutamate receptor ionotropic, kainate 4-like [Haliotis asinina]|uniref:glutamate receptor ionotropic, kainate 4-like n=1 Tax=Haliotis asinina TaxID=109174 RepID=UPI003532439C
MTSSAATALQRVVSRRTVTRRLREHGIRAYRPFRGMTLTLRDRRNRRCFDRIIQPADREWGSKADGKWNGLVGMLARREADLAAAEVTVHEDRYGVVDFVFPEILIDSVDILYRKGELKKATLLDFLRPFQTTVYFCFLAVLPSSCAGRVLVASFWIFCVIMAAAYSAMLTASMAVKTEAPPFNSIRELLQRDDYTIGMIANGAPRTILSRTKSGQGKELWSRLSTLNKTDPSIFSLNLQLQLDRVIRENYALVIEGTYGKQMLRNDCRLNLLSEKLHWEQLTFALPLGSYLTRDFNRVMMQLKKSGIIQHHIAKALRPTRMCDVEEEVRPVGFIDVTGELTLLAAGVALAASALVVEKLVIGIAEKPEEDSSKALDEFIKTDLKLERNIEFDRVHRIGGPGARKPRPIVAKFSQYKDRDVIRQAGFAHLKGSNFYTPGN